MLSATLLLAVSMVVGQAEGEKVFTAYTDFAIGGTWKTMVDGTPVESTYTRIEGSKFVQITNKGGPLPFVGMIGIDPETKKCTFWFFNNDGGIGKDILTQESDDVWLLQGKGNGPEGKVRYKGRIIRVDEDTVKEEVIHFSIGDESIEPQTFTWKR